MTIKSKLFITSFITIAGIIGIAVFSLITIMMVQDKITLLTSQSTPLQVKTVQFQQAVEKLSADLLQLGLSNDPQEVRQISASIVGHRESLEKINADITALKKSTLETGVFTELHEQVLKATDEKFKSMAVFKEEAAKMNGAMTRVDTSLFGLKDILAGLVTTATRRAVTATKSLNESISDKSSVKELLSNVHNYRNEVDHDIELNKKINVIHELTYAIGVDAKLLDAKSRMIMLSETPAELDKVSAEAQRIQGRISRNVVQVSVAVKEIKSSGFIDETLKSISGSIGSAGASLRTIAASQRHVLENMARLDASIKRVKAVALEQGRQSEANVQSTAQEQQKFVAEVSQRVGMFKTSLVGTSIVIVLVALLLGISTTVSINRSLRSMTETIVDIAVSGDFTKTITIRNKDEFGVTMQAFNSLIESFTRIIATVSLSSEKLSESSQGLTGTAQEIHKTTGKQSANIGQVAAASMEMAQTVTMISSNTARITESAREARNVAMEGAEVVTRTGHEVQEIAQAVEESTRLMRTLQERSKQVGEIVDVIVEITDQTNLLALNAAIEAARAGDHGRGFAVVADEVRKLANSTADATVGITERVRDIQGDTELAVNAMQTSLERVRRGVEYSDQAGGALRHIVDRVAVLQDMVREISVATEELAVTSDEISTDIIVIERSAAETVQAAAAVACESDNLLRLSVELKEEISRFNYRKSMLEEVAT